MKEEDPAENVTEMNQNLIVTEQKDATMMRVLREVFQQEEPAEEKKTIEEK